MRLHLHPQGLIRLFSKHDEKPEGTRPETIDPDAYEVTPYGRRPKRRGRRGLKATAKILAVGAAAVAVWFLL